MQTLRSRLGHPAFIIAALTILGYGLLVPYTGFYWDDWPFAWIAKFLGPAEFLPAFAPFRPFLGPIFFATTSLVPPIPLYWQIFAVVIRFLMGLAVWWTFRQVWPERPRLALTIALLLTVFPGYSQHWVAFTHINQELIPFLFYVLSIGFTFRALGAESPTTISAIAMLLQICGIFPSEYFFGMEGLRGLLLFVNAPGNLPARMRATIKTWWPYLCIWLLNALWLVYYYRFGPYNSYAVTGADETTHLGLLPEILDTLWKVCFLIWAQILVLLSSSLTAPSSLLTMAVIMIAFALILAYRPSLDGPNESRNFAVSLMVIGVIGILLGRLPSLAAGLPLRLQSSFDRFMISMMIAGCLFLAGLVELIVQNARTRMIVISAILALGVGQQFFNANIFRRDWQNQGDIYWQLTWRMPALRPHTLLLTYEMPIDYETDLSFTAPLNWMYAPDFKTGSLPYALLYTEKRLGGPTLPSLERDVPIRFRYRTVDFNGSTSQAVVIYKPANGCLRVLEATRGDAEIYANLPAKLTDAIPLSSAPQIIEDPEAPASPSLFFSEPEHTWCYYFTKAELAYQRSDFRSVIALGEDAASHGYRPEDPNEQLIFVEALAREGDLTEAAAISSELVFDNPRMLRGVCTVWGRMQALLPAEHSEQVSDIVSALKCSE